MRIIIKNLTKFPIRERKIKNIVRTILGPRFKGAELGFTFVGAERMRRLNKRFTKRSGDTDVLSFGMLEGGGSGAPRRKGRGSLPSRKQCTFIPRAFGRRFLRGIKGAPILGDVVISVDAARRNARIYGNPVERELCLYVIHGILHLAGYSDRTKKDRYRMQRQEQNLLTRIWPSKI